MHKKLLIVSLVVAFVLIPAAGLGATLVNSETDAVPSNFQQYLVEAAEEMELTPEQATVLLAQARELRIRISARHMDISYEELRQRIEERRKLREDCDGMGPFEGRMLMRRAFRLGREKSGD